MRTKHLYSVCPPPSPNQQVNRPLSRSSTALIRMVIHDFNEDELEESGALNLPTAHLGDLQSIHPIFQRGNIRCTDDEYEALKPSLRLASAYLSESGLQVFWQTILFGARQQIPNTPGWSQLFRPNPPFRTEHYQAFGELLVQMRSVFGFRFGQCTQQYGTDPWGMAQGWDRAAAGRGWQPPPGITGLCSVITLHGDSLESAMSSYNLLRSATGPLSSETTSLILRQQFFLANTTMHELAHAMNNAQKGDRHEREPFVGDQRRAELGYAWEAFVHGGRTAQIHETRSCDCGLYFGSWPPGAEINEMIGPGPATGYGYNRWASRKSRSYVLMGRVKG